jgi:Flp pilus assembly protein CpaB
LVCRWLVGVVMARVAVLVAGIALIVLVQRMLLVQAVARDAEANHPQSELDEVI